jgi:prolyl-tRNA editing enzyme YbaK/EbsC (Cys-tRNA(Pro) deacylase)
LQTEKQGTIALLLVGKQRINFKKLKSQFGKVRIASIKEVIEVSGVKPGSICPFIIKTPKYVDKRVLNLKKINFGSGHQLYGLEINSEDLCRVIDYKVIDAAIC